MFWRVNVNWDFVKREGWGPFGRGFTWADQEEGSCFEVAAGSEGSLVQARPYKSGDQAADFGCHSSKEFIGQQSVRAGKGTAWL